MNKEIERKFLVDVDKLANCSYANSSDSRKVNIAQGYLIDFRHHTLRIRTTSDRKSYMTYKGPSTGISRTEVEFIIPTYVGNLLLGMCRKVLHKTRNTFPTIDTVHNLAYTRWEVDTFHNLSSGELVMAEIEIPTERTTFSTPDWLMEEVSTNPRYYISNLIKEVL